MNKIFTNREEKMVQVGSVVGNMLSWIVVKDLEEAIKYYTEVVGLELLEKTPEYGWAELSGPEGAKLGIAQESEMNPVKAGQNAVMAIRVADIEAAREEMVKKGAVMLGEIEDIPGHVRMQTFRDASGNMMQLAQEWKE